MYIEEEKASTAGGKHIKVVFLICVDGKSVVHVFVYSLNVLFLIRLAGTVNGRSKTLLCKEGN